MNTNNLIYKVITILNNILLYLLQIKRQVIFN